MSEILKNVLAANVAQQKRARQLNIRAGAEMFPVLDRAAMTAWMTEKAAGASRMEEIVNPEALRLPAFDEVLIEMVIRENPDEIELLGAMRSVVYRSGYTPKISLESEAVAENRWFALPDEGVFLPGGRPVKVEISLGWSGTFSNANISELKGEVLKYLNRQQWDNWPEEGRPEISFPDAEDETASIPEIITVQYGQCVVTGTPLFAYGVASAYQYWSSDPITWKPSWHKSQEEAEATRAKSVEKLETVKTASRESREIETAKQEARAVKEVFESFYSEVARTSWDDLPSVLRNQLQSRYCSNFSSSLVGIRQWQAETEALIAEVKIALAEIQREKELIASTQQQTWQEPVAVEVEEEEVEDLEDPKPVENLGAALMQLRAKFGK